MHKGKKVLLRADGNFKSGLGHLFRIIAVHEMLKTDFTCVFVIRESTDESILPIDCFKLKIPDHISILKEAEFIQQFSAGAKDIIFIDGYEFSSEYQKSLKEHKYTVICIDDLCDKYMFADVVINHSLGVKEENYSSESYTRFFLGPKYSLLRNEFLKASKEKINRIEMYGVVFVNFGGSDQFGLSRRTVDILLEMEQVNQIHVAFGKSANNEFQQSLSQYNSKDVKCYYNIAANEIISILKVCNLAIVPCSTILFELCSVGIPIVSGYYVNNQKNAYQSFNDLNLISGVGDFLSSDYPFRLKTVFQSLDPKNLGEQVIKQKDFFDGAQGDRIRSIVNSFYS